MYFKKVLLLDNYDSFTFNLLHIIEQFSSVDVYRNDEIELKSIDKYDAIIISPGPGLPENSGILLELIDKYKKRKPMLGICLGHQAIAEHFKCKLINLEKVQHGVSIDVNKIVSSKLFKNIPDKFKAGLYYSWKLDKDSMSSELIITAISNEGVIMAFEHKELPIYGVQFHPESIMTKYGKKIIENFLFF